MDRADLLGFGELRTTLFYRRLTAETLGIIILVVFGCGSGMNVNSALSPSTASISLAWGLTVAGVVWIVGNISGPHVNPAVSLAMFATRQMSLTRFVGYVIVQCIGAIAGAAILWELTPPKGRGTLSAVQVAPGVTVWQGLVVEVIATFILVLSVYATVDEGRKDHSAESAAMAIGFVVTMIIPWAAQYSGAGMNPARSLGPAVITGLLKDHWIYWVGPAIGSILAALCYQSLFHQRWVDAEQSDPDRTSAPSEMKLQDRPIMEGVAVGEEPKRVIE